MPITFTDNHTCEKCGKAFVWNCFELIRQNIDSPEFIFEPMPHGKTLAHSFQQRDIGIYDIEVNCPHCNFDNYFSYVYSQDTETYLYVIMDVHLYFDLQNLLFSSSLG